MRPAAAFLPILFTSFSMIAFAASVSAAESDAEIIRVESVGMEALGYDEFGIMPSSTAEQLTRIVARASNGRYLVAVRSNIGITRLKGAYLDSALTVEDGSFTFYYANGRVESAGRYISGNKSGTWMRYAMDGTQLAERNYTGLNTDQMMVATGIAQQANTGKAVRLIANDRPAARRSSDPVEF